MNRSSLHAIFTVTVLSMLLAACAPVANPTTAPATAISSPPEATPKVPTSREAQVQSVEIQVLNHEPAAVTAIIHGNLTESCATLGESHVQYAGNTFRITVYAVSPNDKGCLQTTTPFETAIPLDTRDLPAGNYTVTANGVSGVFTWPVQVATPTAVPTATTIATSVPSPTAAPVAQGCTDAAAFVADVTVPDNSLMSPGAAFTKIWRLRNTGTCTWNGQYLVSYISGTTMTQQPAYYVTGLAGYVEPGQTLDVSVGMTAPIQNGYYASYWGLTGRDGRLMPIYGGAKGNSFYVKLKVGTGTDGGQITSASIEIEPEQGSGPACTPNSTYFVHAHMTSDGATTASYEIDSSAGQISAGNFETSNGAQPIPSVTGTLTFDHADTKTMNLRFVGPYPYPADITVLLWVNRGQWYRAQLACL